MYSRYFDGIGSAFMRRESRNVNGTYPLGEPALSLQISQSAGQVGAGSNLSAKLVNRELSPAPAELATSTLPNYLWLVEN